MIRKFHNNKLQTNPWHREDEPDNNHETNKANQQALSSPSRWLQNYIGQKVTQEKVEQLQNPTIGVPINNNRITALERTAAKATMGSNAFHWYQIFALDSAVIEEKNV